VKYRQGDEVEEALADMFAYDYDRNDATLGEDRAGASGVGIRDWQTPSNLRGNHDKNRVTPRIPYPATMAQYRCDATDEHFNSTILSHGYFLFVQNVGHDVAGAVLHRVPAKLSARPRYIEVMRAFKDVALEHFGATASQAAVDAFKNGAGIGLQDPAGC
jgi:Zn-dependent metalloprotease